VLLCLGVALPCAPCARHVVVPELHCALRRHLNCMLHCGQPALLGSTTLNKDTARELYHCVALAPCCSSRFASSRKQTRADGYFQRHSSHRSFAQSARVLQRRGTRGAWRAQVSRRVDILQGCVCKVPLPLFNPTLVLRLQTTLVFVRVFHASVLLTDAYTCAVAAYK
jgi:hypothetical protein